MITLEQARLLQGRTLFGARGEKLGKLDTLYADREDGEPTFATVHTGLFGTKTSFVPLSAAEMHGDDVVVPYDKDLVHAAPTVDVGADLEPEEEERLYRHYGVVAGPAAEYGAPTTSGEGAAEEPGRDEADPAAGGPGGPGPGVTEPAVMDPAAGSTGGAGGAAGTSGRPQADPATGAGRLRRYPGAAPRDEDPAGP